MEHWVQQISNCNNNTGNLANLVYALTERKARFARENEEGRYCELWTERGKWGMENEGGKMEVL